jgi:predicted nucleotidyltransferase
VRFLLKKICSLLSDFPYFDFPLVTYFFVSIPKSGIIEPNMGKSARTSNITISNALFGETRQAVLRLLFGHVDERFYQGQLIRELGLGSGAVQRELARLSQAGVLTRTVEGHQIYYQANKECPIFEELRGLTRKTVGAPAVIQQALAPVSSKILLAFIYGSTAQGSENRASDIDLMIVSDVLSTKDLIKILKKIEKELRREVNPTIYKQKEFSSKLVEGHHFLTTVAREPKIFLVGDESELKRLAQKRLAH